MRVSNRTNGFLSMEEINEGAYYRTYLVRNITEAKKVTTAAKECDIVLADIWLDTPAIYCKLILCHSFTTSYSTDGSKICIYKMSYGRRVQKSQGCPKTIGRTSEDFPSCPITRHDY